MIPTNKLRFVEKTVSEWHSPGFIATKTIHVLQQWWETASHGTVNLGWGGEIAIGKVTGEWRDVPLEVEEK